MGQFTTKLELGQKAYGVTGGLDPMVQVLTVGQIRVYQTHPKVVGVTEHEGCYREAYMCFETGVGTGTVWEYGRTIFATEEEAKRGVVAAEQRAYAERKARAERLAFQAERRRDEELATLRRLREKYPEEATGDA